MPDWIQQADRQKCWGKTVLFKLYPLSSENTCFSLGYAAIHLLLSLFSDWYSIIFAGRS